MPTGQNPACNLPFREPLRWTLFKAAREFEISESVLKRRLVDCHEFPARDDCYGTSQLIHAMYGSIHIERLRKLREEADKVELENAITRADYLHRGELARGLTQLVDGILQVVTNSALSREEKEDILNNVSNFPAVLRDVAGRQTRFRSKEKNGKHPEKEEPEKAPEKPAGKIEYQV